MKKIKHYNLVEKIGVGGMGIVYKAFDTALERHVAIKLMHSHLLEEGANNERFMREARAAARLIHPNIVTIHEIGEADCGRYIVMEYVEGKSLAQIFDEETGMATEGAIEIIRQILAGLSRAHKYGILHRDIKPDNIFITAEGNVKILDFGIAKMTAREGVTLSGDVLGTVEYMAPEQMLGEEVDQRCDIYAVGVLLYQLLTGRLPYTGETPVAILYKQLNEDPVPPSYYNNNINQALENIVLKAIRKAREDRWDTAEAFASAIETAINKSTDKSVSSKEQSTIAFSEIEPEMPVEIPAKDAGKLRAVFVGREREFKKLVNLYRQAASGQGQTVIVRGEAGVGKSTLANQLRQYVKHNKGWGLYGECLYEEGMDAYLPYIDAFRGFFSTDSYSLPEKERHNLKEMVRENVPLLMEFTERFTTTFGAISTGNGLAPNSRNLNLLEGIYYLVSFLSTLRPTVLIIDDLQWADEASLRLFHYLSRHIENSRVLLLGIVRTDRFDLQKSGKPAMIMDMLSRMRREGIFEEISLERFSRQDCEVLIDQALSSTVFSEEFYDNIYRETKGNPFFILETLKLLRENGKIYFKEGSWYDKQEEYDFKVPNRVEDVFIRQLSELSNEEREILQIASIIGYKFDISMLSKLLEMPRIKLLKILQRVERDLEILANTESGFQFEHPLLRDLLYEEIPLALRREYHLIVAEEIETLHTQDLRSFVGEIAQHYRRGGDYTRAIPMLYKAAVRAFNISAYREAATLYEDLLHSLTRSEKPLPEHISEADIYFKLGISYDEIGQWENSLAVYEKLLKIGKKENSSKRQTDALLRMGRIYDKRGEWELALQCYQRCLQIVDLQPVQNVRSRVFNNLGVMYFQKGDFDKAAQCFERTLKTVDSEIGELDKAHALTSIGVIANMRSDFSEALANYHNALEIYQKKDNEKFLARVYHNIGITYSDIGGFGCCCHCI